MHPKLRPEMAKNEAKDKCEAFLDQKRQQWRKRSRLLEDELFRIMKIIGGNREGLSSEDQSVSHEEWVRRGNVVLAKSMAPMTTLHLSDKELVKPKNLYS